MFRKGREPHQQQDLSDISEILKEPDTLVWFDVSNPGPHALDVLQSEFDLHPLAVEDAIHPHERPKIEEFDTYWLLIVVGTTIEHGRVVFHEIAIFMGSRFMVTVRHDPAYSLDEISRRWKTRSELPQQLSSGFLLYTILDEIVDGYLPVAEHIQDRADDLEDTIFNQRHQDRVLLREIFMTKNEGRQFRHAVLPMRDILNPIIRGDLGLPQETIPYFRDVYDHVVLVIDQLDNIRDLVQNVLDIHLSFVANKQNEIAKQLTLVATIFLPLSFIVGFFGQNFSWLVEHIGGLGAFVTLGIGIEVLTVMATLVFFRVRGWF